MTSIATGYVAAGLGLRWSATHKVTGSHKGTIAGLSHLNNILHKLYLIYLSYKLDDYPMRVISFSDARNKLKSVLDQVVNDADYTIITRRDSEDAVVMSLDQFNRLMETVHLLKSPANAAHLSKSIKQYRAGKAKQHALSDD